MWGQGEPLGRIASAPKVDWTLGGHRKARWNPICQPAIWGLAATGQQEVERVEVKVGFCRPQQLRTCPQAQPG